MWGLGWENLFSPSLSGLMSWSPCPAEHIPPTLGSIFPHTPVKVALLLVCFSKAGRDFSEPSNHFTDGSRKESKSLRVTHEVGDQAGPGAAPPLRGSFQPLGLPLSQAPGQFPPQEAIKSRGTMGRPITPAWQSLKVWLM